MQGKNAKTQMALLLSWAERGELDPQLAKAVQDAANDSPRELQKSLQSITGILEMQRRLAANGQGDPVATVKEIKKLPLYGDPGIGERPNWLAGAFDSLQTIDLSCNPDLPNSPGLNLGPAVIYLMWGLIGIAVAVFVFLALKHFAWAKNVQRRAKALLEEDEPERTLDEWLVMADDLEKKGLHREAVRCLYLACLLKLDEGRVARFERGQTNWEHLFRIEASPRKPPQLDFRPATRSFDTVWYGMRVRGSEDVAQFRHWYTEITEMLRQKAA